jgi:type IV pilus assembly protein PilE
MPLKYHSRSGFTLIELMIVVGVIGILASIAYPSYMDYVRKARRTEAQSLMLNMQLQQEKYRVNHAAYASLADLGAFTSDYYTLTVPVNTALTYTITAVAKTGTSQASDTGCTTMTLNQASQKTEPGCWKK